MRYCNECGKPTEEGDFCEDCYYEDYEVSRCIECKKTFLQERDIQLCDNCVGKFNLDKLWKMHDNNKLDVLDFNELRSLLEKFRLEVQRKLR